MSISIQLCCSPVDDEDNEPSVYDLSLGAGEEQSCKLSGRDPWFDDQGFLDKEQGVRWLNGKRAADCTERLFAAFTALHPTVTASDNWEYSMAHFCLLMWSWCKAYPNGVFRVG